jgi:hypothetical protein
MNIMDKRVEAALDIYDVYWRNRSEKMQNICRLEMKEAIEASDTVLAESEGE